jgi:DNA-binding transcriptional LysR family regulator
MRITFAQLEAFYWISRLGSFREAGRYLHLAQPTISLRIRDLEEALGQRLFDRIGRQLRLTNDGEALLDATATVLTQIRQISERVGSAHAVGGIVRLGVPETFALVCLPTLLQRLGERHPSLRVELDIGTSSALADDLIARRIDVAFVADPMMDPRIRQTMLGKHRMVWAAAPSLVGSSTVRPSDLRAVPVISNPAPTPQYRILTDWFRSQGMMPLRHSFCNSVIVIAHLVRAGVAASILPVSMIKDEVEAGRIVILQAQPDLPPSIMYACHPASEGTANIDAVIRATTDVLDSVHFLEPLA